MIKNEIEAEGLSRPKSIGILTYRAEKFKMG